MNVRKQPIRTCVACRQVADKRELLRFVRTADGNVVHDASGRAPGRGAYLHDDIKCFDSARKSNALSRALKTKVSVEDFDRLRQICVSKGYVLRDDVSEKCISKNCVSVRATPESQQALEAETILDVMAIPEVNEER